MLTKATKNLLFAFSVFVLFVLTSCQKGVDIDLNNPPPIPDEIKDSTLLIKSIRLVTLDPVTGLPDDDSIKEDYFYDTINKKIILTFDHAASHPDYSPFVGIEHSYDANGLLTNVIHKYKDGFVPDDDHLVSIKLDYDADKVLRKIDIKPFNGNLRTVLFNKTLLASGKYELKWNELLFGLSNTGADDSAYVRAIFDKEGKCLKSEYSYSYQTVAGGGDDTYTQIIITDSLIYDASGSISKITVNRIDTLSHEEESFVGCEFLSRHIKGDQLYNMQQVLLNGIANIPFGEDLVRGSISGILSYFPDGYEPNEYNKFPFQTAKIYDSYTKQYNDFIAISEFDSKDRLIKFRGFLMDNDLIPYQYQISYYK